MGDYADFFFTLYVLYVGHESVNRAIFENVRTFITIFTLFTAYVFSTVLLCYA